MLIRRPAVVVSLAGLALSLPAAAQTIPWLSAVNGNWSDTTKWTGGNVPNTMGETAVLGLTGAYTVTQNVDGLMINGIDITNADAVLNLGGRTVMLHGAGLFNSGTVTNNTGTGTISGPISNGASGRINVNSATSLNVDTDIANNGLLTVNPSGGASTTTLHLLAPVAVTGSGSIVLNNSTTRGQITAAVGASLTNGAAHTIRGEGQITAPMTNNGLVSASKPGTSLLMNTSAKTNNGVMKAAGGTLDISVAVTQGASGLIFADGSNVTLSNGTIVGGDIDSDGAGRVRNATGTSTLSNVDSTAHVEVASATMIALTGGYTNDGILNVNPSAGASTTSLRIDGPMTIDGTGEIRLNNTAFRSQIIAGTDGALTLGPNQLVHGRGQITVGTTNNGVISADVASGNLLLNSVAKINNGLIRAAGGTLEINGIDVTQGASGGVLADASEVILNSASITGGLITSENGGLIRTTAGTSTLDSVDSEADVLLNSATVLVLTGAAYTNNGLIDVNPGGGASTTSLRIGSSLTIDGAGEIRLGNTGFRAQIIADTGADVTFGPGQVVHGVGQVSAPAANHGEIIADNADGTLELNTSAKTNTGLIRATGDGTLGINGITIEQTGAGEILADSAPVLLANATIVGGDIGSAGSGVVRQNTGSSIWQDVAASGSVEVVSGTALELREALVNNATILVNPSGGASTTTIRIEGEVPITGNGQIILNNTGFRSQILAGTDAYMILGAGQTIRGIGQIATTTTVAGAIAPGLSVGTLTVNAPATLITWESGSTLDVELASLSSFDKLTSGSHTINGGDIIVSLVGGYTPALFDTHAVINGASDSIITGRFDGIIGPALPSPYVWKIGYPGDDVVIGVSCPSDINADFTVDILDFLDFIDDFSTCENQPGPCGAVINADYNGDTFVDILDFLDFIDAFANGC